jgi:hypothetical protein
MQQMTTSIYLTTYKLLINITTNYKSILESKYTNARLWDD